MDVRIAQEGAQEKSASPPTTTSLSTLSTTTASTDHHQQNSSSSSSPDSQLDNIKYEEHLGRLLSEKSIQIIEEFHERPKLKKNIEISQIKLPRLGSLSFLKPMIEENTISVMKPLGPNGEGKLELLEKLQNSSLEFKIGENQKLDEFQLELYSLLKNYKDLLYTNESQENINAIQKVYVLHVLNHLICSRAKIIENNKVFERKTLSDGIIHDDPKLRDQGYTRARILFLLPFRYSALKLGKCIVQMLGERHNVMHFNRFIQEFGDEDGGDSALRPVASDGNKPGDHYQTFHGNTDDAFRIGLKLTKKSLKFFADFYDSDIIIASPLGLKTILSPEEQHTILTRTTTTTSDGHPVPAHGDQDFLSSIEIVILDQAEIFLMQNWEHLLDIMQHINLRPSKPRKMDIARIRMWHLENWSKYYRQLLMFSSVSVPLVHSFFQANSLNYEGYLTFKHRVDNPQVKQVTSKCKQQFLYYDSTSAKDSCDDRYNFFTKQVLPRFTGRGNGNEDGGKTSLDHTLVLVSSYFDYVRLRNYFRREKLSFTQICEYTEENKVAKARQLFYFGARQFLIYTERCHFYHRYKIKGIRNVIFYEPPVFAKFYNEITNMLAPELQGKKFVEDSTQFISTTLFSNHDTLQLGAIIGYSNAVKLIQNKKSIT